MQSFKQGMAEPLATEDKDQEADGEDDQEEQTDGEDSGKSGVGDK